MSPEVEVITPEVVKEAVVLTAALASPDHTARAHDKISPSKLNYLDRTLGGCPGFRQDPGTNAAAEEGTRLHEILDGVIKNGRRDNWFVGREGTLNLPKLPQGSLMSLLFTERIRTPWDDLTDYNLTFCAREVDKHIIGLPAECIEAEIRVDIVDEDDKQIMYGHLDLCLIVSADTAVIFDWKFGFNPVLHASVNRQGLAYAVGILQRHPRLNTVGVVFIQPKRNEVTKGVFHRRHLHNYVKEIKLIRDESRRVSGLLDAQQVDTALAVQTLNPGDACDYCNRYATCPAVHALLPVAVEKAGGLPSLPMDLKVDAIQTPQQAAVAMAWVRFLSDEALDKIKSHCMGIARANDGRISYTAPDGTEFAFKIQQDKFDRVVGDAVAVSEALTELVDPKDVLGAAKLAIGRLTDVVVPAIQAKELAETGEELPKKDATERLESILTSVGLLSRPEGYTESLRREKVAKTPKKKTTKKLESKTTEQITN